MVFLLLRNPEVQTLASRFTAAFLTQKTGTTISIDGIQVELTGTLHLTGLVIEDEHGNEMIVADELSVALSGISRAKRTLRVRSLHLTGAEFFLRRYSADDLNNLGYFMRHFTNPNADTLQDKPPPQPWTLLVNDLQIRNAHFIYEDADAKVASRGIDYNDMELLDMDLLAASVIIDHDTISTRIQNLTFVEKSGFELKEFSGIVRYSPVGLSVNNLLLITNNSNVKLDLAFAYPSLGSFKNFIEEVHFDGTFGKSKLDMSDIGYFAETMFSMTNTIGIEGSVKGTVSNIRGSDLDVTYGTDTRFVGSVQMNGLPDFYETFINTNIKTLTTRTRDIRSFGLPGEAPPIQVPDLLMKMGLVKVSGKFTGFYNDFVAKAVVQSRLGGLRTNLVMKTSQQNAVTYQGNLVASNLDIGTLLDAEENLGKTSFTLDVDGEGFSRDALRINTKGIIQSLQFHDYDYNNIAIDASLDALIFKGRAAVDDQNLGFVFDGLIDFNDEIPRFDFKARIDHADLNALHFSSRDSVSILSTAIDADMRATSIDDISGTLAITNTSYIEGSKEYKLKKLQVVAWQAGDGLSGISLASDYIDARLEGYYKLSTLSETIGNYTRQYSPVLAAKLPWQQPPGEEQQYLTFNIELKNTDALTDLFVPALKLAPQTIIEGTANLTEEKVKLRGHADWIKYTTLTAYDWNLETSSSVDAFELTTGFDRLMLKDLSISDTAGYGIDSLQITTRLARDTIQFELLWNDLDNTNRNTGQVGGYVHLDSTRIIAALTNVNMTIDSALWSIRPGNRIAADTSGIVFDNLNLYSDTSWVSISGGITSQPDDSLHLAFASLDISELDQLIRGDMIDVNAILSGKVTLVNLMKEPNFLADITLEDLFFNGEDLGMMKLKTTWNDAAQRLRVDTRILRSGNLGVSEVVGITGDYFPTGTRENFDLDVKLNNLGIQIVNPFISDYAVIDQASLASGALHISGSYNKPVATGTVKLMRTQFLIKYLNSLYSIAGSAEIAKNSINVSNLVLYDTQQHSADLSGNITHDYFKNFRLAIYIDLQNLRALNTSARDNEIFYGTAVATGKVAITGPFDDILMGINASTNKGTRVIIPINTGLSVSENDFIIFINDTDTIHKEADNYNLNVKGFTMNMELDVTPEAEIEIYLPDNMGNIKGRGNGDIGMGITPRGDFTINGDYIISEGSFFFNFENLIGRNLKIRSGSKISWTGDPLDATVDITATYTVKTNLAGLRLQTDSTALRNTRVEVQSNIHLMNALFNPDIRFSIDFTNVTDDTKEIIFAALDTTDQSAMSQQIISLLVLGSFSYTTAGPNIGATGFKLLSNQLSDWLSKISKDFDIGINYQPGSELSEEELEVALRTQLFNDRLSIDGNFGVRGTKREQNTSNVVGDINVEYKITNDGRFRIKAFNRTNDISFLEDNAPYTQGVGIFFRKEFDGFNDLFGIRSRNNPKQTQQKPGNDAATKNEEPQEGK
ncbi:MAG TPA: translocation/assembly module TamB domain-containing protein [Bacteroidales bacterium]|nr:translocation/assembly module TamB domain-containing protein [Bacteroidales bacterium]